MIKNLWNIFYFWGTGGIWIPSLSNNVPYDLENNVHKKSILTFARYIGEKEESANTVFFPLLYPLKFPLLDY